MDSAALVDRLEANVQAVRGLIEAAAADQIDWKPDPKAWSILEVAAHLLDEEREDFRIRLGLLLEDPAADWPSSDPQRWITPRTHPTWSLKETVAAWIEERAYSLRWLRSLRNPAWENTKTHVSGWTVSAGDMFASWVAHDVLHARQLVRLHWAYLQALTTSYDVGYAGDW
jgi:hypothetical protein